ncbi:MAG TPA: family 16 glycosylhydrolase [Puia sp.]|nr:family 16 glycosylhydrolase [Puia sp.]
MNRNFLRAGNGAGLIFLSRAVSGAALILLLIIALASCKKNLKAGDGSAGSSTVPRAISYQLVWADEFNGTSLNTGNWNIDVGNPGVNSEQEYYQASNVTETGGNLVITAQNQSVGGQPYTSGKIETYGKFSTTYGRIEARIALPMVQGMWPAFWMLGNSINTGAGWPECGEIDIMEQVNTNNTILGTMHWFDGGNTQYGGNTPTSNTPADFHIYAVEWNSQSINWYVDNVLYVTGNISNNINNTGAFQDPFYIILNLAVGGTLSGPTVNTGALPTSMLVDYVHVYNITSAAPPVGHVITLKGSNGLFVTSNNGDSAMECNRATAQAWEQFTVGDAGNGLITLKGSNGLYVTSNNADSAMECNRTTAQGWEQFRWIVNSNGTISLQGTNGDYVTSNNGTAAMECDRTQAQGWEQFTYSIVN